MIDLEKSVWEQRNAQGYEGAVKTVNDIARYQTILDTVKPRWVVEAGTFNGMSAVWFANHGVQVVTIDTHPQVSEETRLHPNITWITGSSTDLDVLGYVKGLVRNEGPVVVSLDSDHSAHHVYAEMVAYAPLVEVGSYMVVEDGIVRWLPEQLPHYGHSSPLDAIERFLEQHPDEWEVDSALEDEFLTTQHPKGFLRRIG